MPRNELDCHFPPVVVLLGPKHVLEIIAPFHRTLLQISFQTKLISCHFSDLHVRRYDPFVGTFGLCLHLMSSLLYLLLLVFSK